MKRSWSQLYALFFCAFLSLVSPVGGLVFAAQQQVPPAQVPSDIPDPLPPEIDPIPVMFPHPETDRFWVSIVFRPKRKMPRRAS